MAPPSTSRGRAWRTPRAWWRRSCWRRGSHGPPEDSPPEGGHYVQWTDVVSAFRRTGEPVAEKTEREKAQANIAENRKAYHDYHLLETFEAGIVLLGTEVKSIREGRVNLRDSFARVEDGEVFLYNVNISPYSYRGYAGHEPLRQRTHV